MDEFISWGRYPSVKQNVVSPAWLTGDMLAGISGSLLPYGQGRSYGDSCLNDGGSIISTKHLNRFISFDEQSGLLKAEAGVTLEQILDHCVPLGWFLPVTPGTKFVSLGGAIANDVHGKNHHRGGTFGCHVKSFELLRSDGSLTVCSPEQNSELFAATVGGLGLTGFITWVELQLRRCANAFIRMESIKFGGLDEFFEISKSSDKDFEYTVAWLDCVASGASFGRGIFMRGNHATHEEAGHLKAKKGLRAAVPFDFPPFALNNLTVRAFNTLYYNRLRNKQTDAVVHYDPFFYPLDCVHQWNRIYGSRGLFQFQCVVPAGSGNSAIREILRTIVGSGRASFLAVMKEFGSVKSPGMLSFPRPGVTLCLDFPNQGAMTLDLFGRLERMVVEAGGAMYPAKDACMRGENFRRFYPRLDEFSKHIDPRFSSSFWRRVMR